MLTWIRKHQKRLLKYAVILCLLMAVGTYYVIRVNQKMMMAAPEVAYRMPSSEGPGYARSTPPPPPEQWPWYDKFFIPVAMPLIIIWWSKFLDRRYAKKEQPVDA